MRIVVIGSNSFSGSHVAARALKDGHDVLGISRSAQPDPVFLPYTWEELPGRFSFIQRDLNRDMDAIGSDIAAFEAEVVINLAAQSMVGESWSYPQDWYRTNVVALAALVEQLQGLTSLQRYVHVTTPEVYGTTPDWTVEHEHFAPSTPYAVSRAAGDWHLIAVHRSQGFPVVFTRAANVYGPGQQLYRIIPRTVLSARLGRSLSLHGGGTSVRAFIHIQDVADATLRIATSGTVGQTYHISTNDLISIRDLVLRIYEVAGIDSTDLLAPAEDRPGKDAGYLLDSSRLRSELGWVPTIDLDEGLQSVFAWVDANLEVLRTLPGDYVHKP